MQISALPRAHLALPLLIICGAFFAAKIVFSKFALDAGMQHFQLGIFGNLASALMLAPVLIVRRERIAFERQHVALYLALGLISVALPLISYFVVTEVGAGYKASVYSLSPLMTMGLAAIVGLEQLSVKRILAILFALGCVFVLLQQQFKLIHFDQHFWIIIGLSIPLCAAIGNIIRSAFWPAGSSSYSFSFATLIASSLMMLPFAPLMEDPSGWEFFSGEIIISFTVFATLSSISYVLNYKLQALAGAVFFSQVGSIGTGFGVLFGALLFGESVTVLMLLALIGIVLGSQAARAKSG